VKYLIHRNVPFAHVIDHSHSQPVPRSFPLFKRCEWLVINCNVGKRACYVTPGSRCSISSVSHLAPGLYKGSDITDGYPEILNFYFSLYHELRDSNYGRVLRIEWVVFGSLYEISEIVTEGATDVAVGVRSRKRDKCVTTRANVEPILEPYMEVMSGD